MGDRIGQQLGNYRLTQSLNQMRSIDVNQMRSTDVYLGEHIHLGTVVMVQVLEAQTDDELESFRNTARLLAQLNHANVVRILDYGVDGKTTFMVMLYPSNGTLRQLHARRSALPVETVLSYLKQVGAGLQYIHDQKVIHRDIKPGNIFLGSNNDIMLGNFGLAIRAQNESSQDKQGTPPIWLLNNSKEETHLRAISMR